VGYFGGKRVQSRLYACRCTLCIWALEHRKGPVVPTPVLDAKVGRLDIVFWERREHRCCVWQHGSGSVYLQSLWWRLCVRGRRGTAAARRRCRVPRKKTEGHKGCIRISISLYLYAYRYIDIDVYGYTTQRLRSRAPPMSSR